MKNRSYLSLLSDLSVKLSFALLGAAAGTLLSAVFYGN